MSEYPTLTGILDELIRTLKDGEKGYQEAAKDVESDDLRSLFTELSTQRAQFAGELQLFARSLGEREPETEGSALGVVHRDWIDLKSALASKNGNAILVECERGENSAVRDFTRALDGSLPIQLRLVLSSQLEKIRNACEKIHHLKEVWQTLP